MYSKKDEDIIRKYSSFPYLPTFIVAANRALEALKGMQPTIIVVEPAYRFATTSLPKSGTLIASDALIDLVIPSAYLLSHPHEWAATIMHPGQAPCVS
jgi:hypothetical protein